MRTTFMFISITLLSSALGVLGVSKCLSAGDPVKIPETWSVRLWWTPSFGNPVSRIVNISICPFFLTTAANDTHSGSYLSMSAVHATYIGEHPSAPSPAYSENHRVIAEE
ncbi:hypothetical protein B0H13DRAFT_1900632 [Mycena leptocephala]|nr:hypothetical protein B0H13DRAFT_1900632 [Mycena leptocephala]